MFRKKTKLPENNSKILPKVEGYKRPGLIKRTFRWIKNKNPFTFYRGPIIN